MYWCTVNATVFTSCRHTRLLYWCIVNATVLTSMQTYLVMVYSQSNFSNLNVDIPSIGIQPMQLFSPQYRHILHWCTLYSQSNFSNLNADISCIAVYSQCNFLTSMHTYLVLVYSQCNFLTSMQTYLVLVNSYSLAMRIPCFS